MPTSPASLSAGFDYLYSVRVLAVALAFLCFWREYARWSWSWSWFAVGLGVVVFVIWMVLELVLKGLPDESPLANGLDQMRPDLG